MKILLLVFIALAGAGLTVQAAWNSRLRDALGSPVLAPLVSIAISLAALAVIQATGLLPRGKLVVQGVPPWAYLGGLFGAAFLVLTVIALPRVGAGALVSCAVLGQMVAALVLDGTGAFGVEKAPIGALRIVGAVVVMIGVLLVQHRPEP